MGMLVQRERRSSGLVYPITTVTDGLQDVPLAGPRDFVFIGSGVNSVHRLLDARRYPLYAKVSFYNATPEFVGVQNQIVAPATVATTWHRVPPRAKLECVLISKADAGGVWHSQIIYPLSGNKSCIIEDDAIDVTVAYSPFSWSQQITTTGAASSATAAQNNTIGVHYFTTGAGVDGGISFYSIRTMYFGMGACAYEEVSGVSALSTALQEYWLRVGTGDGRETADATDGVYFEYDRGVHGDDCYRICTANNGSTTKIATTIQPSIYTAAYQKLRFEVNSDGSRADFWNDQTYINKITTNIPTGTARITNVQKAIKKKVGTTGILYQWDRTRFEMHLLTGR
jgi:hypothetical protein